MSTLTFLPYIGHYYNKEYIIPNYIGESLSSLIPGLLALAQGVGNQKNECSNNSNSTNNNHKPISAPKGPNFSVSIFFILMFGLLNLSIISFSLINYWSRARNCRKSKTESTVEIKNKFQSFEISHIVTKSISECDLYVKDEIEHQDSIKIENRREISFLFFIAFIVSFINYGFLPGLLSYSTINYSQFFFYLSINLSNNFIIFYFAR